jgi:hypothetical protein
MKLFLVHNPSRDGREFTGIMAEDDFRLSGEWGYENLGEVRKSGKKLAHPFNGFPVIPFTHLETGKVYGRFSDWSVREL